MRYLHTMLRVRNLDVALKFYQDALGLKEVRRIENDKGRFTLVFLCSSDDLEALKEAAANARRAAGRAHLQLGRGEVRRGSLLRPSRL
ncbi:catechol 2,3-dioxygenase-like lactoylglutathione lyase family enzyme [Bradyrhizobium japonicum]